MTVQGWVEVHINGSIRRIDFGIRPLEVEAQVGLLGYVVRREMLLRCDAAMGFLSVRSGGSNWLTLTGNVAPRKVAARVSSLGKDVTCEILL